MTSSPLAVIKYGGHAMDDPALNRLFARSLRTVLDAGWRVLVGHGGGPHINALLERLHVSSEFKNGLRVTSPETMEVVEMALAGKVNTFVVSLFCEAGIRAVGLSGKDDACLRARPLPGLGLVGEVETVNPALVQSLMATGFTPVLAPIGYGPEGISLNINADTATGAMAGALQAEAFILVTDVPGVLDADKKLLPSLTREQVATLRASEVISGGMIPKVESCLHALNCGCQRAIILDGRSAGNLEACLLHQASTGTVLLP